MRHETWWNRNCVFHPWVYVESRHRLQFKHNITWAANTIISSTIPLKQRSTMYRTESISTHTLYFSTHTLYSPSIYPSITKISLLRLQTSGHDPESTNHYHPRSRNTHVKFSSLEQLPTVISQQIRKSMSVNSSLRISKVETSFLPISTPQIPTKRSNSDRSETSTLTASPPDLPIYRISQKTSRKNAETNNHEQY